MVKEENQYAMAEGMRRHKGGGKASKSDQYSQLIAGRRPLKTVQLPPPDFKVQPQILTESYIEKEIRFAGIVSSIPVHLDATNRTDVLRVIDRGKREESIPWKTSYEHDAIFCLNVHNVKLSKRDGQEDVIQRLAIHEIAAACYIRDDDKHIIAIKYGEIDFRQPQDTMDDALCKLAVMYVDCKPAAEEICSLIEQCFHLVYTDATMQFLDRNIRAGAGISVSSSTIRSDKSSNNSTPNHKRRVAGGRDLAFLSTSNKNLAELNNGSLNLDTPNNGTYSSITSRSLQRSMSTPRRSSVSGSDLEQHLIGEYMQKLFTRLSNEELKRFASIMKAWHTNMPFLEFCEKVMELYGPARKYLLTDMRPFIPEKDQPEFERFLERVGLGGAPSSIALSSRSSFSRQLPGGAAGYSSIGPYDDVDQGFAEISNNLSNLGSSVDNT